MLPEQELAVISLLASYAEINDTPVDYLRDPENEQEYNTVVGNLEEKISLYFPELSSKELDNIFIHAFDKCNSHIGGYGAPLPKIAPEHEALVEKGYNEYLRRKAATIEMLNSGKFLGKLTSFIIGYELINYYADIVTKI